MNIETRIPPLFETEMSPDGEVIIPDSIRRAAGMVPGMPLVIGVNDQGQAVVMTRTQAKRHGETPEARHLRIRAALDRMTGRFSTGQTTADVMAELRDDRE